MRSTTAGGTIPSDDNPLNEFSGCHEDIIDNFHQLKELLVLTAATPMSDEIRGIAGKQLSFFKEIVLVHHAEEEQELFTAVLESAEEGEEIDYVRQSIRRLVQEHRDFEAMWGSIEADIRRLSKGKPVKLDRQTTEQLAHDYLAHAEYEERDFLPLAAKILKKNELSALGLSLHMRHQGAKISGYI